MYTKTKYTLWLFALLLTCYSCSNDTIVEQSDSIAEPHVKILLNASENIRNYTDIYVFNGQDPKLNHYKQKMLNVERATTYLKMNMPVGTWNNVIVGCSESDIRPLLILPTSAALRSQLPMWQTNPVGNILPDVPEIRTALLDGTIINQNEVRQLTASLDRNVARVRVVLKDGVGFKTGAGHSFSLNKVPTTLAWDGSLYPSRDNPAITSVPMTKSVTLSASRVAGHQKSDTIDFIIPAHKSKNETDITTHKMVLGMKFITLGSTVFEKNVEIQTTAKDNKIMLLNVTAKGGVEVAVEVQEWKTVFSTDQPKMYEMKLVGNTGNLAKYSMHMMQERNWWLTLDDATDFEFVDGSTTFGQKTDAPINIEIKRKGTNQTAKSTVMRLHIVGLDGLTEEYAVTSLK